MSGGYGCNLLIQDTSGSTAGIGSSGFEIGLEVESLDFFYEKVMQHHYPLFSERQHMGWGSGFAIKDPEGHMINLYQFARR